MSELPTVTPYPVLTDDDLRAVLEGVEPGRYTTATLWPRYEAWAAQHGHVMVSKRSFGMALRRALGAPVGYGHGHVGVYAIG